METPTSTRHPHNVDSMLGQRHRRWPSIKSTLGECLVLAVNLFLHSRFIYIELRGKFAEIRKRAMVH